MPSKHEDRIVDTHKAICKPFKETGYCGYGDTCKYSHERYIESESIQASSESELKCGICRKTFEEEVVTDCGHSFCSFCAIRRYQEVDECGVCKKPTYGKFWVR